METVLVSALQHWSYCPRQCGLIHLESIWDENVFTIRGNQVHERADEKTTRSEKGKRVERGLPIWSETYGLQGRADVVEFDGDGTITPVEYKSGKARREIHSSIQLCAQALCLEEMFSASVVAGAVFYASSKHREPVVIDDTLREKTISIIEQTREMLTSMEVPPANFDRRCPQCSLIDACLPQTLEKARFLRPRRQAYAPAREIELP